MNPEYRVQVTHRDGTFELRIRELLLVERGANLADVYARLIERKREIAEWARAIDALDELPAPAFAPKLHSPLRELPGVRFRR